MRRIGALAIILLVVISIGVAVFRPPAERPPTADLTTFLSDARSGRIEKVEVKGNRLTVWLNDGSTYVSRKESDVSLVSLLSDSGVEPASVQIEVKNPIPDTPGSFLLIFLPLIVIVAVVGLAGFAGYLLGKSKRLV